MGFSKIGEDKVLPWIQRLEIAVGSARALWFLHTCPEGCIVHRDIKVCPNVIVFKFLVPISVLLDSKWRINATFSFFKLVDFINLGHNLTALHLSNLKF